MEQLNTVVNKVREYALGKFAIQEYEEGYSELLLQLAPEGLSLRAILRLKRLNTDTKNFRTILITIIDSMDEYLFVQRWCAMVKEELVDPESADLYSLTFINDTTINLEDVLYRESGELHCRKYIGRPGENIDSLLQRTFLGAMDVEQSFDELSDPLSASLLSTSGQNEWMTDKDRIMWREAFLSGKGGAEIVSLLFSNKKSND